MDSDSESEHPSPSHNDDSLLTVTHHDDSSSDHDRRLRQIPDRLAAPAAASLIELRAKSLLERFMEQQSVSWLVAPGALTLNAAPAGPARRHIC